MDKQSEQAIIIDWTDRKEIIATYRKYDELGIIGPSYQYYNGKLQPAPPINATIDDPAPYRVGTESEDRNTGRCNL